MGVASAVGDPSQQHVILWRVRAKPSATSVRHRRHGLEQQQALLGLFEVHAPRGLISQQRIQIGAWVLPAKAEPETILAVEVAMAGALIASRLGKDGHHVATECNPFLCRCNTTQHHERNSDRESADAKHGGPRGGRGMHDGAHREGIVIIGPLDRESQIIKPRPSVASRRVGVDFE